MKKFVPFIVIALAVVVAAVVVVRKINQPVSESVEDQSIPDLPENQRPLTALIPTSDGHYLILRVNNINIPDVKSMDYELLYKADNNGTQVTQGVPGTIQLAGSTSIERKLLLGSESSGKFRYDKGVEKGQLTLRFRDSKGKLIGKVVTDWHLQSNTTTLTSVDGSFKYTLDKAVTDVWFITMKPFATPNPKDVVVYSNGWAVYASDGLPHSGK